MASAYPVYKYIISKTADPLFAAVIGLGAAASRISKEEQANGRDLQQTLEVAKRRVSYSFDSAREWLSGRPGKGVAPAESPAVGRKG